jgi:alpha-mannosidase
MCCAVWFGSTPPLPLTGQASGAYIFRPDGDSATPNPIAGGAAPSLSIAAGALVQEATMQWGGAQGWAVQKLRLYADAKALEVEYTIGPVCALLCFAVLCCVVSNEELSFDECDVM